MTQNDKHPNPDQALVVKLADAGLGNQPLDSNALARSLGGRVRRVVRLEKAIYLEFTPADMFLQGNGVVQGGIVSAMLDFALTFCTFPFLEPGQTVATTMINVSFLKPVLAGKVMVVGTVERQGRTVCFTQARLTDENGNLLATATSALSVLSLRRD